MVGELSFEANDNKRLAAETHAMMEGLGLLEFCLYSCVEMPCLRFNMINGDELMKKVRNFATTDAKSVWDHLISANPAAGVVDERSAVDFIICQESILRLEADLCGTPGVLQLADALTKEGPEGLGGVSS